VARRLLVLALLLTLSRPLVGQVADSTGRVPFPGATLSFPERLEGLREPRLLQSPWGAGHRIPPALRLAQYDSVLAQTLDSARAVRTVGLRNLQLYGISPALAEGEAEPALEQRNPLGISRRVADLGLEGAVRLELRSDRLRNERCTPFQLLDPGSGCRGGFRAPRLDNHIALRSGGLIAERLHLNVDYDNDRDFDANNDLQVFYEGLEDEVVQRVEVGTVNFLPPRSRFITAAVPTNNFGVNARFEVGAVQLQTLLATQKGSQVAERTYTIGQTTSQAQDRQLRDLDFESGRFYWVVDPGAIAGYPALDILNAANLPVTPAAKPAQVRVYRWRPYSGSNGANPNIGGITATARTILPQAPFGTFGPVQWELLIQNVDYYLDPSGLWLALSTKLDANSYLAVSYITGDGTTVGSFPATDKGPGSTDSLRLVALPSGTQIPSDSPTLRYEMRQVYRVAGSDLDPSSLEVSIALNRSERPQSGAETYLALLGLSLPTDPNLFDRDNRLFPRSRDPEAAQVVHEAYLVYPHLQPFADATKLSPAERADTMYRTPLNRLLQETSTKYVQRLRYNSTGVGDRSTLNLGQLQIRQGSEQLEVRGRRLEKGVDYNIDYEVGQITFLNPNALFGEGTVEVKARYEVQELFTVAPTTVLGLASTYSLGELGAVNLIGLYQAEKSAYNRPPLGFEASANLVGGANTELHFKPNGLTSFLNSLMPRRSTAPSTFDVNAEFAFTRPDPNRSGQAYLEEFEAEAGVQVSLGEQAWGFGSMPQSAAGLEDLGFVGVFNRDDAVALTWQNLVPNGQGGAVELRPQDIDTLIKVTRSNDQRETALFFTLHADTAGGVVQRDQSSRWTLPPKPGPRWRSIVTPLSSSGIDLSTDEYLEFWLFNPGSRTTDSAGVELVLDLGNVNEDALAFAPESFTVAGADTVYQGRQYVGTDRLDTERRSIGTFDAQVDDIGILNDRPENLVNETTGAPVAELPLCERVLAETVPIFPWGDLSGRCTRGNGVLDSEDLNGDNGLNNTGTTENVFRYVVPLQVGSPYYVRDGVRTVDALGRVSKWELYRIPVRSPSATIGTPTLRSIQHMRLTVVAPDRGEPDVVARFALARLHFVGTSWVRRAETPITGLAGSLGKPDGEVIASIVSTENESDLGYTSPPGVFETTQKRGDIGSSGEQINERSLRLVARQLGTGDRGEAYIRFPAGPQNMLAYRELRFWARGRGPGWEERELEAFIKVGSDDRNFYLYRAPAHTTTWEPEMVVDLEVWRDLRAQVEQRWLAGLPPSGSVECGTNDPNAYVACKGPYLVHLGDPGINPPNLAAAQELSAGIYRVGGVGVAPEAELWIDDIRLSSPVSETGKAVAFDTRLVASDVGSVSASFTRQDGQFRLMNVDPTYRTTSGLQLDTRWQLDRFLPTGLGITAPMSVTYARANVAPQLLTGTDLRAEALPGLRKPETWSATYAFALRRSVKGSNWFSRSLLDPLAFNAAYTHGNATTEYSAAQSSNSLMSLTYNVQMRRRGFRLPLGGLVDAMPSFIRSSETGRALRSGTVSLVPSNLRFNSTLSRDWAQQQSFSVPIARPTDNGVRPALALTHLWRNSGGFTWQPIGLINLASDVTSTRDLRVYPDSTSLGRLAYSEREFLLGIPVGVERDRVVTTSLSSTPRVTSWLGLRILSGSSFVLSRSLTSREPVREDVDSGAFILPQTLNNLRSWETGFTFDLPRLLRGMAGDSGGIARALGRVRPFDVSRRVQRTSTFDLAAFNPSLGYMLALGGLENFLEQEGTDALGSSVTWTTNVTSGADLPYGFSGSLTYGHTSTDRYQLVSQTRVLTTVEQREWPVGNVRWNHVFRAGTFNLFSAGVAFRHREGSSFQAGQANEAQSAINSDSWRPDLQIGLRNGMSFTFSWNTLGQETANTSSTTVLDQNELAGNFSHSFRMPRAFGRTRRQVRSTISALYSSVRSCLEQASSIECTTISDVIRQELRGGLDTDVVSSLTAGLQVGYSINEARHLNQRTSQISLLASFQWSFDTGGNR
jgi:motility/secretion related protein SprA